MSKKTRRKKKTNQQTTVYVQSGIEMIEYNSQIVYVDDLDDAGNDFQVPNLSPFTTRLRQLVEEVNKTPMSPEDRNKLLRRLTGELLEEGQANQQESKAKTGELTEKVSMPLVAETKQDVAPPPVATFLCLLIPIRQREHLLGDLVEEYRIELVPKFGLKWARFYFYWHVIIELAVGLAKTMKGIIGESVRSRSAK